MSKIFPLGPGVAYYRNDESDGNGACCLIVHYTADPERRDPAWPDRESAIYAGGRASVDWRMEQEIDFDAEEGLLTFYAYDRRRNVIPLDALPAGWVNWPKWIAVDPGGTVPTCVLFFAQNPKTQQIVVWDEIYRAMTPTVAIKFEVYERFAQLLGLAQPSQVRMDDVLDDGVGDPAAKQELLNWGFEPWPIPLRGNAKNASYAINSRKAGENRVNEWLSPSFVCCMERQYVRDLQPEALCRRCGKRNEGSPILVFVEGRTPNLCRTLPMITRRLAAMPSLEAPEVDMADQEDHAPDALRYGCMAIQLETTAAPDDPEMALLSIPAWRLEHDKLLDRVFTECVKRREQQRAAELEGDDDDVLRSEDPIGVLESHLGLEALEDYYV